jgi:alanine racemase
MHNHILYSTWAEVDLRAIEANIRLILKQTSAQVMAIVKANAYGHGTVPVAKAALRAGATWCGVGRIEEAFELRRAGLDCPILLMGYTPPGRYDEAISSKLSITIWDYEQLQAAYQAAVRLGENARLHLKVDTGMSRLGVQPEDAFELARTISLTPGILYEGLYTHFACADESDNPTTQEQENQFIQLLESLETNSLVPGLVHAANSAASLTRPSAHFNLIRAGISIYGLHPSADCPLPPEFKPALSWKSVLSLVKVLPPGRGISYGHRYTTRTPERIGTVPVGYADGFRRTSGNKVLVSGRRVHVVGRVCMDLIMIQLNGVPEAETGDEVVLIGTQGDECISADEVANRWGTINYEVTCGIGARVPRVYWPQND